MKKNFVSGLAILLPVAITYWILKFALNAITAPFEHVIRSFFFAILPTYFYPGSENLASIFVITKIFIVIFLLSIIIAFGYLARVFFIKHILALFDRILTMLPFINRIYLSCKDFTHAIFSPKSGSFTQVVLAPFPSPAHHAIGLVTNVLDGGTAKEDDIVSVLIPGTPNPTIGFLLFYTRKQLIYTDTPVQEAIKYVVACGSTSATFSTKAKIEDVIAENIQ